MRIEAGVTEKDRAISALEANLREKNATLFHIYDSHGWKTLLVYYKVRNKILPPNTWREKAARSVWNIFRKKKPAQEKVPDQNRSIGTQSIKQLSPPPESETVPKMSVNDLEPLEFPVFHDPRVSIIVPVCNKWEYTYNCLRSLLEHTGKVPYEVIMGVDGYST